jgi:hypothetical protein
MTYAFQPHLYIENGPAVQAARRRQALSSSNAYRAWRALGREHRFAAVEAALAGANDDVPAARAC